jgi:hypothetical protein
MGIHLAAESFEEEGFIGRHNMTKYTVIHITTDSLATSGLRLSAILCADRQAAPASVHLVIGRRSAARQLIPFENMVQIRRDFLESQIVVLMAMGAANFVKVHSFRLLCG